VRPWQPAAVDSAFALPPAKGRPARGSCTTARDGRRRL